MSFNITRRDLIKQALATGALASLSSAGLLKLECWAEGNAPPAVWLEGAGCSGCLVSLLNHRRPGSFGPGWLSDVDLKFSSLVMGASGEPAIQQLANIIQGDEKDLTLIVSGAIPNQPGYCSVGRIGQKTYDFKETLVELAMRSTAVLGVGTCSGYGGIPATRYPDPRFAPLEHYLPWTTRMMLVPGCPPHPDWIVAGLLSLLADEAVTLDLYKRPASLFAQTVCSQCPRLSEKEAGHFAPEPGDPVRCLQPQGCRGGTTHCDVPTRGWSGTAHWCVSANSICNGCTEPTFPESRIVPNPAGQRKV